MADTEIVSPFEDKNIFHKTQTDFISPDTDVNVLTESTDNDKSKIFNDTNSVKSHASGRNSNISATEVKKWNSSPAKGELFRKSESNSQRSSSSAKSKRTLSCKSAKLSRMLLNREGVDSESQNELMKNILMTQFDKYESFADDDDDDSDNDTEGTCTVDNVFSLSNSGHHSNLDDEDYDTDLEVDIDQWLNEERGYTGSDLTGEKKYITTCESAGVVPASYFVRHISENDVCMRFHGLGPQGVRAMCVPLKTNSKIEKLDLDGNDMERLGCISLSDMLRENIYITKLVLSNNRIGNEGAITLCGILKKNDSVLSIDLSGNELGDVTATHLSEMLQKNTTIKHLYLSHNSFEEKGAEDFYEVLSNNEVLESLDLSWNRFRTKGAICIAEGIQENYGLKSINLCMNGFSGDGATSMGKALKVNRTLQELDLCFNRIPDGGVEELANGLQTNDVLKTLKIGSNPFGGESALMLLKSVDKNDSSELKFLELINIEVTAEFIDLKKIMEVERSMKIIHGGIVYYDTYSIQWKHDDVDNLLNKDPMSILKRYIVAAGYRLIDFFKDFDKDGNMYITKEELANGLKKAEVNISEAQLHDLIAKLDKDKNGQIDFAELIAGDKEYRELQRQLLKQKLEAENKTSK